MSTGPARTHRIAVMGGDGVGPELVGHAIRLLDAVADLEGFTVDRVDLPNSGAHYRRTGVLLDDDTITTLRSCESLLFGAAGDPALPSGLVERALVLDLSRELGLTLGVRTGFLHHERLTPLKGAGRGDVDVMIVRDTSEGELAIPGGVLHQGTPYETASSVIVHTRFGAERAIRHAFAAAAAPGRRGRVTLVAQSNVLAPHRLWQDVFEEIAAEHPEIDADLRYPDAALQDLVLQPGHFDVIVSTLLYGGMLTDLVAALVGGIGLIGSSRTNAETGFGMFEPAHGSAPKYTGRDLVSPMATFRALAMLLAQVGEAGGATRIDAAIDAVLSSGEVPGVSTRSGIGTAAATEAVLRAVRGVPALVG